MSGGMMNGIGPGTLETLLILVSTMVIVLAGVALFRDWRIDRKLESSLDSAGSEDSKK